MPVRCTSPVLIGFRFELKRFRYFKWPCALTRPGSGLSDRCRLVQSVHCSVQLMRIEHSLCNRCKYWNMTSSWWAQIAKCFHQSKKKNRLSRHFFYLLIANYTFTMHYLLAHLMFTEKCVPHAKAGASASACYRRSFEKRKPKTAEEYFIFFESESLSLN